MIIKIKNIKNIIKKYKRNYAMQKIQWPGLFAALEYYLKNSI